MPKIQNVFLAFTFTFCFMSCSSNGENLIDDECYKSAFGTYHLYQDVWTFSDHIDDVPLTLKEDYSYEFLFNEHSYSGTYTLKRIENKDTLLGYETSYPSPDKCRIYQIAFSKLDVSLPDPLCLSFDGNRVYQYLYCYTNGSRSDYGVAHVIERKSSGGVKVDAQGNVVGREEKTVYLKDESNA